MTTQMALQFTFDSMDDYLAFMGDPKRVTRLEWRKLRQPKSHGLTSHSWLEAYLLDGSHIRYDFFADHGLTESLQAGPDPTSELYEGRAAATHEFSHPLTLQALREKSEKTGVRSYSMLEFNCHHFVLAVWNSSVIRSLQRSHYPDRVKTSFLSSMEGSLGSWLGSIGASWSSNAAGVEVGLNLSIDDEDKKRRQKDESSPLARISMTKEEGSRVTGDFTCIHYERPECEAEFVAAIGSGKVLILDKEGVLTPTSCPLQGSCAEDSEVATEKWAASCLASIDIHITRRIAKRIGKKDTVDLLARVLKPKSGIDSHWSLASMASASSHSLSCNTATIVDTCYIVLNSDELRLVIYAVVKPYGHENGRPWRLRLLSGDAYCEKENFFQYTLRDVADKDEFASVQDVVQEELPALKMALMTNDWGFITLL